MDFILKSTNDEIIKKLQNLQSRLDVASLLEIKVSFLTSILYGTEDRKKYHNFNIKKKSQHNRLISSPPKNLSILQKKLLQALSLLYNPRKVVHGFCKDRSIVSNAIKHTRRKHVLNIDLKDFFPSIHIGRVKGVLRNDPYNFTDEAATTIAQICTSSDGILPQGAATSPLISNLVCRSLDTDLMQLAKRCHCTYTRYADDITFSTTRSFFSKSLAVKTNGEVYICKELEDIINKHSFNINFKKVRIQTSPSHQEVTGLTVNEFPNIKRWRIRTLRAAIYAWKKHGYEQAENVYLSKYLGKWSKSVSLEFAIRGHLSYIQMVRGKSDPVYRKIVHDFNSLTPKKIKLESLTVANSSPLRGGYPQHDIWRVWYARYEKAIVLLEIQNKERDTKVGTGFYVGKETIITAGHNLSANLVLTKMWAGGEELQCSVEKSIYVDGDNDVGTIKVAKPFPFGNNRLPCHFRLPEIGEEVAAIGYPRLPLRREHLVLHTGIVEALPLSLDEKKLYIQVSFHSGGGLSGGPLLDKRGNVLGIMIENIFQATTGDVPSKPFGQAIPIEYSSALVANTQ